jgi:glycine/serine hydroxymethyltransferase
MKEAEMLEIAEIISDVLHNPDDEDILANAKEKVESLTKRFALYPNLA